MKSRCRRRWSLALAIACLTACPAAVQAAEKAAAPNGGANIQAGEDEEWKQIDAAAKRAVAYLLSQQEDDGSIDEAGRHKTTMTALAIVAMCSVGHKLTDQTKEGETLRRALAYVLDPERQDPDGYFGRRDQAKMYGQGIVTLMLAEVLGMGVDEQLDRVFRERLRKAIDLILRAQAVPKKNKKEEGGWRYEPNSQDTDLSVTSWQLISLRAAKNAGMEVPKEAIDKAVAYVKRCYFSRREKDGAAETGYFTYTPNDRTMRFGSAAGGLLTLQICGEYDAPEVKGAADYFLAYEIPEVEGKEYFYYGMYYYAQAMRQRGGKYADHARKVVRDILLKLQEKDGSWHPGKKDSAGGIVYVTSLSLLSLSIHYYYLPIYQR